ncbi:MAG TPA: hypothetical protein VGC53_02795 [Vicinamibacteria bacterium]
MSSRASLRSEWRLLAPDGDLLPSKQPDGGRFGLGSLRSQQAADAFFSGLLQELWIGPNVMIRLRPPSWSPDEKTLVYSERAPGGQCDIGLLTLGAEPKSRHFLQTEFSDAGGAFSRDGLFVAYVSNESGREEIYVRPFSGAPGK